MVAKIRLIALPSALTVDFRIPAGATSNTFFTSAPVGTTGSVPGTSVRKLAMPTMLEAFARTRLSADTAFASAGQVSGARLASPYRQSCSLVKLSTNFTDWFLNAPPDTTYIPSSLEIPACCSISWMSRTAVDDGLTHSIGSVWIFKLVLDQDPADEDHERGHDERRCDLPGHAAEEHDEAPERTFAVVARLRRRLVLTDAERGQRAHDRNETDRRDTDREQEPEAADHRNLREAQGREGEDRVERDHEQRGTEVARALLDRMLRVVDDHLLLDARVHLDRVVDADAEHHRQAADRDERERDAEVARRVRTPRSHR